MKHFDYGLRTVAIPRFVQQAGKLGAGITVMRIPDLGTLALQCIGFV
ncbi:MAG: hypothetical protein WD397_17350 [Wenzhouxiangellaceae bacterium]